MVGRSFVLVFALYSSILFGMDGIGEIASALSEIRRECAFRTALAATYNSEQHHEKAKDIRAVVRPFFQTVQIFPKTGKVPVGAKARVLLLHGV